MSSSPVFPKPASGGPEAMSVYEVGFLDARAGRGGGRAEISGSLRRFVREEALVGDLPDHVGVALRTERAAEANDAVISTGGPKLAHCLRCDAQRLSPVAVAEQADRVRAIIEGVVALELAKQDGDLAAVYGGNTRRILRAVLSRVADLALEHSRAAACLAGICINRAANEVATTAHKEP